MKSTTSARRVANARPGPSFHISDTVHKARNAHAPQRERSIGPAEAAIQTNQ